MNQPPAGRPDLNALVERAGEELGQANAAREIGLAACRRTVRAAGSAIRAVHRQEPDRAAAFIADGEQALRSAQEVLAPHPSVAHAGFLHDAEKEFAESVLTRALVEGAALPDHRELGVGAPAWLNGLCEAASELRRHLLDRLRRDEPGRAEALLAAMEDVYEALVGVDYPDAITGGLRRSADSLRAVLERTRSDVATTLMQIRLRDALDRRSASDAPPGAG